MCDYSLQNVKTRDARVADKLIVTNFNCGTNGFAGIDDCTTAVCILPGTELAFDQPVVVCGREVGHKTAIFRQVHKDQPHVHHDTLEFPNGTTALLTYLTGGQTATVLQLPAKPKTEAEREAQTRVAVVA